MHLLDGFAAPSDHTDKQPDCPFCEEEETEDRVTYAGEKNRSTVLASNMRKGTAGDSQYDRNCRFVEVPKAPKPDFSAQRGTTGYAFSFQAHHAISGNQAMKGHAIEEWIAKAKGRIAADTGYSINNPINGIWLPSKPSGSWSARSSAEQRQLAYLAVDTLDAQWHLGHHRIDVRGQLAGLLHDPEARDAFRLVRSGGAFATQTDFEAPVTDDEKDDADDAPGEIGTYDAWLGDEMTKIADRIRAWQPLCGDQGDGKPTVNATVNRMIDRLSTMTKVLLTTPRRWKGWQCFISKLAWEYAMLVDEEVRMARKRRADAAGGAGGDGGVGGGAAGGDAGGRGASSADTGAGKRRKAGPADPAPRAAGSKRKRGSTTRL